MNHNKEEKKFPFSKEQVRAYIENLLKPRSSQKENQEMALLWESIWKKALCKAQEEAHFLANMDGSSLRYVTEGLLKFDLPRFEEVPASTRAVMVDLTCMALCREIYNHMINDLDKG